MQRPSHSWKQPKYYWPGLFREVTQYVCRCLTCQKYKVSQREPAGQMFTRQVEEPFRVVCADFMGPLPRSRHGNALLLVFLDAFKKWVELVPLRKATTALLERAFRNRILSRFGTPKLFVCDNGTQFTSRSFKAFCKGMGMELQHTAPYNPQQNPTERANGTIKTMVVTYLDGAEQSKWDELLPELSLAINTSVSDTTKFSPAFLVQERDPRLPNTLFDQVTPVQATDHPTLERKAERMRELFQAVRDNTARASAEQSRYYKLRRREWRPTDPPILGTTAPTHPFKGLRRINRQACSQIRWTP